MKKFYQCSICGNIVELIDGDISRVRCCGREMDLMVANTKDAAVEKHVPVITKNGNTITVSIGSVEHPMSAEHYIQWIAIQTKQGNQRKVLKPEDNPQAVFSILDGDDIIKAYAYCNLHGLWSSK